MLHMTVVLAQQVTISGQVLDEKSEPLIGGQVSKAQLIGSTALNAIAIQQRGDIVGKHLARREIVVAHLTAIVGFGENVHARRRGVGVVHRNEGHDAHGDRADHRKGDDQLKVLLQQLEQFEKGHAACLSFPQFGLTKLSVCYRIFLPRPNSIHKKQALL